ncbi:tartrate-resistant acid phosphatase type 5 family protein [Lacibacter sp. H375]|uniref:purple acid phosphatase family protein n=1 Tax=Lacibacter sp. H375 TaxID=3133424 RepID=UPI0030BB3E35
MQSLLRKSMLFFAFVLCQHFMQAQVLVKDSAALPKADAKLIKKEKALHFIAMGDWGRNGADHQRQVAKQMGLTAKEIGSMFTIATGDNFYPSGVISEWDPLWKYSFEDIYTDFHLQWDWYPILGNHDYKSNPDAQVKYSTISRRWKMPARYYSKTIAINGDTTQQVLLVFIDTNPLIPEFYKNAEYGPNVKGQDTIKQKRWMEKLLSTTSSNIKWKIVVGHHPMYSGGSRTEGYDTKAIRNTLKPMFEKYKVDVYLAGHEHSLQHMQSGANMHHIISGAASEKTPARLIENSLMSASEYGFFVFSVTGNELLLQTVNDTGRIIYSYTIKK